MVSKRQHHEWTNTRGAAQPVVFLRDSDDARRDGLTAALSNGLCRVQHIAELSSFDNRRASAGPALVLIGFSPAEASETFAAVERLRQADRRIPVVLITAGSTEAIAVAALRAGVKDYFREPVDYASVAASAGRWLATAGERAGIGGGTQASSAGQVRLIGPSASMRAIDDYLAKIARHDVTVLITGETGTGKELAAARIHSMSPRRHGRFVSVNCAAIPEGLLESELFGYESGAFTGAGAARQGLLQLADRGTVFLDEVGDMGLNAQAKVLRAVETREVYRLGGKTPVPLDLRIVAATNHDLEAAVDEGRFRKDLYFRLNVARVHLPPLRERPADIVALLDHYVRELNERLGYEVQGFSNEALEMLKAYEWPGNVRELKNVLEAVFISPPRARLEIDDLPDRFRQRLQGLRGASDQERQRLVDVLSAANWNKSVAAKRLHWSRMTLYRKIAKYSVIKSDLHHR